MEFSAYQIIAWLLMIAAVVGVIILHRSEKKKRKP